MISFGDVVSVAIVPLLAALVVMVIARSAGLRPQTAWPTAIALAYISGQISLDAGGKGLAAAAALLQPHVARDWLPGLIVIALAALWTLANRPRACWSPVIVLVNSAAVPARLLWQSVYVQSQWTPAESAGRLAAIALLFWIVWMAFSWPRSNPDGRMRAALLSVVALATALTLMLSGARVYGLLGSAATVAIVGTALVPLAAGDKSAGFAAGLAGGGPAVAVILGGLLVLGFFYAELTALNAGLLAAAIAAVAIPIPNWRLSMCIVCRIFGVVMLSTIAVFLAVRAFAAALAAQGAYP